MQIGILGAGKIGISIATLLETAEFVDAVVLGDARILDHLDGLRKIRFQQIDIRSEDALKNFIQGCGAIVSAAPYYL
ncbi:MAG TPA: saccharopine dehydrogenase NADP-binding domain-containing protein, partial [Chthoniobacterales bacterium]